MGKHQKTTGGENSKGAKRLKARQDKWQQDGSHGAKPGSIKK
jgi:hypothetical protein